MNAMNSYIKKEVALIGANTNFGRTTSFLLKQSPLLSKLTLYDDKSLKPLDDIKYINTPCQVSFFNGRENICKAIKTADIIIIGDDNPKDMTHEGALMSRVPSFSNYVQQIADHNSNAIIVVATNPVSITVPLAAEVLRNHGKLNERKLIGMTNVENIKARAILADHLHICPGTIDFPVIGGLTSETSVPLLSNMNPRIPLSKANSQKITCAIKRGVTQLHGDTDSQESLNRAYATAKLVKSIVAGLNGHPTVETVLSCQKVINNADYFSLPVLLGEDGIMEHMVLPNISKHEKLLLIHAVACMAEDSKTAKIYYQKIANGFAIPAPQNKLNTLKTLRKIEHQSQYVAVHNRKQNTLQASNETYTSDLTATKDHIASTNSHNENIKNAIHKNKLEFLMIEKSQARCRAGTTKENDAELLTKKESSKVISGERSEPPKSQIYSIIDSENIDEVINLTEAKFINIKAETQRSRDFINKGGVSANYSNSFSECVKSHSNVNRSLSSEHKLSAIESEKAIGEENTSFNPFKTQVIATPKSINYLNSKQKLSTDPIFNIINPRPNTMSVYSQLNNRAKKCVVEHCKSPIKFNNTNKNLYPSENMSEDPQQKCLPTENLDNSFTSNIIRMLNEIQKRKHRLTNTSHTIRNLSQVNLDKNTEAINFNSISNTENDERCMIINKTERKSISDTNFIMPNDAKTSGKIYRLQTNQPHWILHSTLFKSEKYQASKRQVLSRYVSSESHHDNKTTKQFGDVYPQKGMRGGKSISQSQTSFNKQQETLLSRYLSSELLGKRMKNQDLIIPNSKNKQKDVSSLPKFETNLKSPHDTFLSRYTSWHSKYKEIKNKAFEEINSQNKIKIVRGKSDETSSESKDKEVENKDFEAFDTNKEKVLEVNSLSRSKININRQHETKHITSVPDSYDSILPPPKFKIAKYYDVQRKKYFNSDKSSDSCIFENLLQQQKNSISFGHKITSFKTERSEKDSHFMQQRKQMNSEMLGKTARHKNNRNDLQKLHLLSSSKEGIMKNKVLENQIKPTGVNDSDWKNNYFKRRTENLKKKFPKQQTSEANTKDVDDARRQCNAGDNKDNLIRKEGESEKHQHNEIIYNSNKDVNSNVLNIGNNQVMSTPFKCIHNESTLSNNEPSSENNIAHESESGENRSDSNIAHYLQKRPNSASGTNPINAEEVKREENSQVHTSPKESRNDTV